MHRICGTDAHGSWRHTDDCRSDKLANDWETKTFRHRAAASLEIWEVLLVILYHYTNDIFSP